MSTKRGKLSRSKNFDMRSVKGDHLYGRFLGPAEFHNLKTYIKRRRQSYQVKYFDGELFDIILQHCKNDRERKALINSIHSKQITKLFYNYSNTNGQLNHFLTPEKPSFQWNVNFRRAKCLLKEIYGIRERSMKYIPLSNQEDLMLIFGNLKTSAGAVNPGKKKADSLPQIYKAAMKMKHCIKSGEDFNSIFIPALPFHRSQISGYYDEDHEILTPSKTKLKDRLVWGIDGATVAIEGQYARPLINALKVVTKSYNPGMSSNDTRSFISNHCFGKYWLGIDFSNFDQTIPSWLIWEVFDIIKSWFPIKCGKELDWIRYNFIHTRIFDCSGKLIQKHKGIPSGSYFTQTVGSMCNALLLLTYLCSKWNDKKVRSELRSTANNNVYTITTIGDDGLLFTDTEINRFEMSQYLQHNFGVEVSPLKSDYGSGREDPKFLKRSWSRFGESRNYVEFWINSIHPEYYRSYDGYTPWHIIFGLYLTYERTMRMYFDKYEIIQNIKKAGFDKNSFKNLRPYDVPGSLRVILLDRPDYLAREYALYYDDAASL